MNLGSLDSLLSELWGIFTGLDLAWKMGLGRISMDFDSKEALQLVKDGCTMDHPMAGLETDIRNLLNKDWEVVLRSVFREENSVAH